jgi:ribonuclease HI
MKSLNILKVVGKTKWGADQTTLLKLYRTIIRSKLDYGAIVYGSARDSYINTLEPVANQALRLCLGVFRTSPITSIQILAKEPPLQIRREQLTMQYCSKILANPQNPIFPHISNPRFVQDFTNKPTIIPPLGIRSLSSIQIGNLFTGKIIKNKLPRIPPWNLTSPNIIFSMEDKKPKSETSSDYYISKYREIRESYKDFIPVYTDGSKINNHTASAAIFPDAEYTSRLSNQASIYTAELKAILLAIKHIKGSVNSKYIIFSDSKSSLQALVSKKLEHPLIQNILEELHSLHTQKRFITLCWLPSHIGIKGNEKADLAAKRSLHQQINDLSIPYSDLRQNIIFHCHNKWQNIWNQETNNKLHKIYPYISEVNSKNFLPRQEETLLNRLKIGHSYLTHGYLLKGESPPQCLACQETVTVEHILIKCVELHDVRRKYYQATDLKTLFTTISSKKIFDFLKETNLFHKL